MTSETGDTVTLQQSRENFKSRLALGIISIIGGVLGWWASLRLFQDYVASLKDTDFIPSCNLSDVVSCAQNFGSSYGSLLGFSNTVIGLTLFVIPIVMGVFLLSKVSLPHWVLAGYSLGLLGAVALVSYLQWASFTQLLTLCLYCLLIWSVTIPLFWKTVAFTAEEWLKSKKAQIVKHSKSLTLVVTNWWLIAVVHLIFVLAFGELSVRAVTGLFAAIFQ